MQTPQPPPLQKLDQLTPSLYEAILRCKARTAWSAFGERTSLPQHPNALLGICFHRVLELAHKGRLPQSKTDCRVQARVLFDQEAQVQYRRLHPLIHEKFSSPKKLPYYNLFRERAALRATEVVTKATASTPLTSFVDALPKNPSELVEATLFSSDKLLKGRSDHIDIKNGEVVDYKSGIGSEKYDFDLSDAEIRQLRFYVHLGLENGFHLCKGTVVRGNGYKVSVNISQEDAQEQSQHARTLLREFNEAVQQGKTFEQIAEPSIENCSRCPCIPLCEAFWRSAKPDWAEQNGIHVEAEIIGITESANQNATFLTFELIAGRGTVPPGRAVVQQVPEQWLISDGFERFQIGGIVRIVDGRLASARDALRIRVDKISTTVWQVALR
jgi:hypothetical protein